MMNVTDSVSESAVSRSVASQAVDGASADALFEAHRRLAMFNAGRLRPGLPSATWQADLTRAHQQQLLEGEILEWERLQIRGLARAIPADDVAAFLDWFVGLRETGPGQETTLFDWLATEASLEEMRWFLEQEVAGEAGFDDLAALAQLKLPVQPKLEIARNYWDEMGQGNARGMHGPMLERLATELEIGSPPLERIVTESLALSNVMLGLASNRRYAYHAIGALGAVELTAPGRAAKVTEGLKRLGVSPQGRHYFLLHATLDVKHSATWNEEVIRPLVAGQPLIARAIGEGALMRLHAGERCFRRYQRHFGLADAPRTHPGACS